MLTAIVITGVALAATCGGVAVAYYAMNLMVRVIATGSRKAKGPAA